jgi:hypothetical protein
MIAHGKPPCDLDCAPTLPRPSHPEPNVRDDRETPLMRAGTARLMDLIWAKREGNFFCKRGWTGMLRDLPVGRSACNLPGGLAEGVICLTIRAKAK